MRDIKEVFWTGGWDSTFRMVQLSRQDLVIQPVYIGGDNRPSERIELATMNTISALLTQHQGTKAKILPLKIVQKEDIPPNAEITEAFYEIRKSIPIGTQYEYLARYAKLNPYVEIGPECPDGEYSGIVEAINAYGELIEFGDSWVLNKEKSTEQRLFCGNSSLKSFEIHKVFLQLFSLICCKNPR